MIIFVKKYLLCICIIIVLSVFWYIMYLYMNCSVLLFEARIAHYVLGEIAVYEMFINARQKLFKMFTDVLLCFRQGEVSFFKKMFYNI